MKQRIHTWLAIRAIALLDDIGISPDLVKLLKSMSKAQPLAPGYQIWLTPEREQETLTVMSLK